MNILEKIKKKLEGYPQIKFETKKFEKYESIVVNSSNEGFAVCMYLYKDGEFQVCGDGWRYEMLDLKNEDETIDVFMQCLSNRARLRIFSYGKKDYRWDIEVKDDGKWKKDTSVVSVPALLSSFLKQKTERVLQNKYI